MCDPVSATALALSAGGSYLEQRDSNKNQKRITEAKNDAYETGLIKQRQYADEAGQAFGDNVQKQGSEGFEEKQSQENNRVKQAFNSIETQPDYGVGLKTSAPKNVIRSREAESATGNAETQRDVDNFANLSSYNNALFSQGQDNSEFARLFGNLTDKAGRDSNLINLDISAAANNANKAPALFPQLLKLAGTATGMYGAANGITSFGDKIVQGPLQSGATIPVQPGLISSTKQAFGGFI